jgi:hypothetical protein
MTVIHKPAIIIAELGELGRLPDGGIINAGGVEGPHFTIGGKAVIMSDGTASDGTGPVSTTNANVTGYEHVQSTDSGTWVVQHNKNTQKVQVTIWDNSNEMVYADVVKIIDLNTVFIHFSTPIQGRAILLLF